MFSPQRPVIHKRSPHKARPYGQTKLPEFHPRKAYPAPPPTPFDLRGVRHAQMQHQHAPPTPVTHRRRNGKPYSEGTDYPSPEDFKKMHFLDIGPPPRKANLPPRKVGNQIYIDYDDAAQPLVDELKAKGPLDEEAQRALQTLAELRYRAIGREAYHRQAEILDEAIAEAPERIRNMELRAAAAAKLRAKREENERERQRELREKREKAAREERERHEREAREREERARQEAIRRAEAERKEAARRAEAERQKALQDEVNRQRDMRARQRIQEELARMAKQREELNARKERQRIEEIHRRRMEELAAQKRQEEEARLRFERLNISREQRDREERERQEAARRAAEEQARRAREEEERRRAQAEQERLAREARAAQERLAREAQEAQEKEMREFCDLYEMKWAALKTDPNLQNVVRFHEFPYPVFVKHVSDPAEITLEGVRQFLFHPARAAIAGKTPREILKVEVMRWHPDKFDHAIRAKMVEEDWERTKEAAGLVARWVTRLMADSA